MTESRYPGLEQANGEHRDSFATRFADRAHGLDSGGQPAAGPGPDGPPGSGPAPNGSGGYDPGATQFSFGPVDGPPQAPPIPRSPGVSGASQAAPSHAAPDSGATHAVGPDSGATRAVPPAEFGGFDLSKIGGTTTYGGSAGASAPPSPPPAPPMPPPSLPSVPGTSYGSGLAGGLAGSVTGYDPATYTPPSSYGPPGYGAGPGDGSTYRVGRDGSVKKLGVDTQTGMPPATGVAPPAPRASLSSTAARGPRRARLQLKHIDPWSTMKFTLVMSVALFVVWMIAVGLLYGVLGSMGVWTKVNDLYDQVAGGSLITASFVLGSAAVIGAINIVLFTALATVGSFVYNLCSDLVGGIELTLSERD